MTAPLEQRISRVNTFGRITGLLSPHVERQIGGFAEEVIVVAIPLTPRPMSVVPAKRLPFCLRPRDVGVEHAPENYNEGEETGDNSDGPTHRK